VQRAAARHVAREALANLLRSRGWPLGGSLFAAEVDHGARHLCGCEPLPDPPMPRSIAELSSAWATLLDRDTRKRTGAWFTGIALVEPTVARTLAPLLASRDPFACRIVDPAAGAGAFLVAALDYLAGETRLPRADLARCLHGVELDPTAAALAAWTLWEAIADPELPIAELERNVRAGDGLSQLEPGAFDAVLGNPPWETLQGPGSERAGSLRRRFQCQGPGKLQTYRLFTELAVSLLRPGGRLGLLLPASLWFDRGARPVRELLLDRCCWEWLFAFENREGLFPIDCRYRFAAVIAEKGGATTAVRAAFGRRDPSEWSRPAPLHVVYPRAQVERLSPHSGALVEVGDDRDLAILQRMHAHGAPFLEAAGGTMQFAQGDLNMTSDADRFRPWQELEAAGYRPGRDGSLRRDGEVVHWPLLQGAMLWDFRAAAAGHRGGTGRGSRWREVGPGELQPQFAVAAGDRWRRAEPSVRPIRLLFRVLSNATNERTAVCALAPGDLPAGNSVGVLTAADENGAVLECAFGCAVMGSLVYDWALRLRLGGTNLNQFVLADTVWPRAGADRRRSLALLALRLSAVHPWDAPLWQAAAREGIAPVGASDGRLAATSAAERRSLCAQLDVAVARAFGLGAGDLVWILRDCELDAGRLRDPACTRSLDQKGFWRIDRKLPADRRHPAAVLRAFAGSAAQPASPSRWRT
jgi:hypothetical protein